MVSSVAKRQKEICRERSMAKREIDDKCSIDRISMLPDKILVIILSLLTVEEATKTSMLSHRWRYLWTFIPRLDFDGTSFLWKVVSVLKTPDIILVIEPLDHSVVKSLDTGLDEQRRNYVGWVDKIIALHKGSSIEELRVFFNLTKTHQKHIDKWLKYALDRNLRRLELNLTNESCRISRPYHECYTFPYRLLGDDSIKFKSLEKLLLHYVNVNGETVEFFLRNCPLLEHVSISQSGDLSTLKIVGPFPSFKRLEISLCHQLESVEIRDLDIVNLKYEGKMIHFILEDVLSLVELYIGGVLTYSMETELFYKSVKLINLKELVLKFTVASHDSWLPLTNLIRASPYLQKLVLKPWYYQAFGERKFEKTERSYQHLKEVKLEGYTDLIRASPYLPLHCQPFGFGERNFEKTERSYQHLKEVKSEGYTDLIRASPYLPLHCQPFGFGERNSEKTERSYRHLKEVKSEGYRGATSEVELIMHLLHCSTSLAKILVDPCVAEKSMFNTKIHINQTIKDENNARTHANQQLRKMMSPRINLEIL
ncbi:hypothetical protein DH2020_036894 [Rehmannia glutinosa]|uniref:F-box domain-containing protein n=1 Tax=Rehmannia glutinosa TaxID=99300 RepID=A0ABR0V454_REHGL